MAIVWHQNTNSRQPTFINNILAADATTFTTGEALIVNTSGRWTVAVAGAKVAGIFQGTTFTSTTNTPIEVLEVTPGDIFIADYVGAPDALFVAGLQTADISVGGLTLNAALVIAGAFSILAVDTTNSKATVRCKLRQLS